MALSLLAPASLAQSSPDKAKADKLFREGREALKASQYAQACSLFAESQRLDPTAGTLINLADCSEKLGDLLSARGHLQAALGRLKPTDERVAVVQKRLAAIEELLPRLVVKLPADAPSNARLELDGREVPPEQAAQPTILPAGLHEIVVVVGEQRTR
ncbi:MAG: hypothetical protein EOO70_01835, partial [Myxococcaceae bacterium]